MPFSLIHTLVVDDNGEVADLLAEILSSYDIAAVPVHGGAQALVLARQLRPRVLLLNLAMPDVDGFAVAAALRGRADAPRLIAFSSLDDATTRARARDAGFERFLRKPTRIGVLVDALRGACAPAALG